MSPIVQSVQAALVPYATQQFIDNITVALQALDEHQYEDHDLELSNITAVDTGVLLLQRVHDCIVRHLVSVCTLHRITVVQDADIVCLAKLVRSVLLMQNWTDGASIVTLIESDAPGEDILAAVVAMVGELTENQAGDIIEEVDPTFLKGLAALYTGQELAAELIEGVPEEQLAKLRAYRSSMGAEKALAYRMIKAGYQPGYALELYLNRVTSSLAERENKDIAFEVMPFLLMGRDSWQNPLAAWREKSFMFGLEGQDVTAVDAEIIKLLGEFDRLTTQGAAK